MFIHLTVLGVMANLVAEQKHWHGLVGLLVWAMATASGLIPIVRAVVLFVLLLNLVVWWKAALFTLVVSFVMEYLVVIGRKMLTSKVFR